MVIDWDVDNFVVIEITVCFFEDIYWGLEIFEVIYRGSGYFCGDKG